MVEKRSVHEWLKFGILDNFYDKGLYFIVVNQHGEERQINREKFKKEFHRIKKQCNSLKGKSVVIKTTTKTKGGAWAKSDWFSAIKLNEEGQKNLVKSVCEMPLKELINTDENHEIEFKESFSVSTESKIEGKIIRKEQLRHAVLKEITGFFNTHGGVLLIGVKDGQNTESGKPEVIGIEKDNFTGDKDKYVRTIMDVISEVFGETLASGIRINLEKMEENKTVCRIVCPKSPKPVYCKYKNSDELPYIRTQSSTRIPSHREWVHFVQEKF